jgi:hypothetical protein
VPLKKPRPPAGGPAMLGDYDGHGGQRSKLTLVLSAVAAVAVVAAIVIVLLSLTSSGSAPNTVTNPPAAVSNAPTTPTHHRAKPKTPTVNPANVTVSVLNGTAVYHLADSIGGQLAAAGFKEGTITNAATQTQTTTTVEYAPGDRQDAVAVQKALKLSPSAVQPMTPDTQALGCPQGSSCSVVVTVGQDLAANPPQATG